MSGPRNPSAAVREVWEKEAKQRWDGQTHGRGICLLIVDILALMPDRATSPNRSFEFWRDQNKIRGRFIGDVAGNGIVVARLNDDADRARREAASATSPGAHGQHLRALDRIGSNPHGQLGATVIEKSDHELEVDLRLSAQLSKVYEDMSLEGESAGTPFGHYPR